MHSVQIQLEDTWTHCTVLNNSQLTLVKISLSGNVPPPVLNIPATAISFGQIRTTDSSGFDVEISNTSVNTLSVTGLTIKSNVFRISTQVPFNIPGKSYMKVHIVFSPPSFGNFIDTLAATSNGGSAKIPISGTSPYPQVMTSTGSFSFNAKVEQSQSEMLKITNGSINALIVDSMKTRSKYFTLSKIAFPDTITQIDSSSISVVFLPDSVGSYSDTLYIFTNADTSLFKIPLSGFGETTTGITRASSGIPTIYEIYQNYPNPFNPSTTIRFALPEQSQATVVIYDILGRQISRLVNDRLQAGYYQFTWNASGYASGVYFCRIVAQSLTDQKKNFVQVKKLLLMK